MTEQKGTPSRTAPLPAEHQSRGHADVPKRRRSANRLALNFAPMIDVTFLLLIFFVLTTTFRKAEGLLGANLPRDTGAPSVALPISPIIVRVQSTGPGLDDYELAIDSFGLRPAGFGDLTRRLVEIRQNEGFDAGTPVIIAVAPGTEWGLVVNAWNAAVRAECENIVFAGGDG